MVTVGATQGPEANLAEVACSADNGGLITTGGGFSRKFERPWYQHGAVASFFSKTSPTDLPDPQIFNREGRAVSAGGGVIDSSIITKRLIDCSTLT